MLYDADYFVWSCIMIDTNIVLEIINAIMPLSVGILGAGATLFGVDLRNRWQDKRDINNARSKSISTLFACINEAERNIIKIHLCIKTKQNTDDALQASIKSIKKLLSEYDKSAVFLPDSIAQIIESILSRVSMVNAYVLTKDHQTISKEMSSIEDDLKFYKKELRNVFQYMIGVKK